MINRSLALAIIGWIGVTSTTFAELKMPSVFADSMVLQRDAPIHVWGWTTPGAEVTVELAGESTTAIAAQTGRFDAELPQLPAGGPHSLTIKADQTVTFSDVLVGEVWVCSGQSNMRMTVDRSFDADLASLAANYPNIRLLRLPNRAAQTPRNDFKATWKACTPESVKQFSAVGFFYGRQLHQTLGVPIGLIDNAWGGSSAEAWLPVETLASVKRYDELLGHWDTIISTYKYDEEIEKWNFAVKHWKDNGKQGQKPRKPSDKLGGNKRPGNLYNGCLHPIIGYSIRGTIWYQGESNTRRSYQYRHLFPLLIRTWREKWGQGDFPFYWVQLADYEKESAQPVNSKWAELREAQSMTMSSVANTGQAVIIDTGESNDIHPRNKLDVAKRLARWALANDYGFENIVCHSPAFKSMEIDGKVATLAFDHVDKGLMSFDSSTAIGFEIAGSDQKFVNANANITSKSTIDVWSDDVPEPVAVRYAWADNPIANIESTGGLPLTPFRTDDWPGVTSGVEVPWVP